MEGQIMLELTDMVDSIKAHAKSHAGIKYISPECLGRICGDPDVINSLIKSGFLMELRKEGYPLTRKLTLYDIGEKVQFDDYDNLVEGKWGKLGSFI